MNESEIPIDIHTNKLLDWLISRRHVSKDWSANIIKVREKINGAIQDMPIHEGIAQLLSGSYINYYHCKSIVEILKETESDSKNLFGSYGSKRMKDWLEILKLYEKDSVYLGEVASLLLRNVNYEIPALRKQIARSIHLGQDYDKKENDYEKLATSAKNEFNTSCKSLGIKGLKIKAELIDKAREFPSMNKKLVVEAKKLQQAVDMYQEAVKSLTPDSKRKVVETLVYVMEKGDTTVFELNNGKPPSSVEKLEIQAEEETDTSDDVIDFGADIDFGGDVDWGISTEEPSENVKHQDASVARGDEARSVLGHPPTRDKFVNDLMELESFLKLRLHESTTENDGLSMISLPESLQLYNAASITAMLKDTTHILTEATSPTSMHYLNINTNIRYVDQLTSQLQQKLNNFEKMKASKEYVKVQRADVLKEGQALEPKVELLIQRSKELAELIEEDISKRYKGRPVTLMGGVNTL